ncbi:MAG: hemerythrin domain-containing protein, partial [Rubrivivax sp.]|nr:hemerythrin domain-containing protein [Rubrivivax sp.]
DSFHRLLAQLESTGLDEEARRSAREILAFFNGPGRHHHEDEEKHVFPGLLAQGEPDLVKHVQRLMQDHGWLEEDWRELAPQIEAIADGYNWYDMGMLTAALPVFTALYLDHIALEESLVYPEAKKLRAALLNGRGSAGMN